MAVTTRSPAIIVDLLERIEQLEANLLLPIQDTIPRRNLSVATYLLILESAWVPSRQWRVP